MEIILLSDVYAEGWIRGAGTYKLATELRCSGYNVQVIDFASRLTREEAEKIFNKFINKDTFLLGVSNTFLNRDSSKIFEQDWMLDFINDYKNRFNFKVVIGGNRHCEATLTAKARSVFDILVSGFADRAIVEIAAAAKNNDLGKIDGITINEQLFVDCKLNYVYDDFHTSKTIFTKQDCIFDGEALPIETARGCKFRCSYCFFPGNGKGNTYKHLKDKTVLTEELIYNYENFGVTQYDIMDDLLNDSPEKCKYIHDVFSKLPFKIKFGAYARSDLLISHIDTLPLLEESGCVGLQFGIETLNKKSGSLIGKGMDRQKTIEGLHYIKENSNISLGSGFIFGLPFESLDSIQETIDWLSRKDCPLDNKEIYPLSIPNLSTRFDYSKLMIDPLKYGYKNLEPNNKTRMIWDNGHINYYQAQELSNDCLKKFKNHNHFNAHQISRVFNMGYDLKTILETPAATFRQEYESIGPESNSIKNKKEKYLKKLYDL
jgi:radical SAM superfamily enzyme YgiQ (UPF0313 family)